MSVDPIPAPPPPDLSTLNHWNATALAYWGVMILWCAVLMKLWSAFGPGHPVVIVLLTLWINTLTPGIAVPVTRRLPLAWSRISPRERHLHRILGVPQFARLLERSGWNRNNVFLPRSLTRTNLHNRALAAHGGLAAHGTCYVMHIALATAAYLSGHRPAALWILFTGIPLHFYPALLQRSILLRLQPLMTRYNPENPTVR